MLTEYLIVLGFSYGIKSVNGVNRISGEGLEANDVPGMLGGGGRWPGRLDFSFSFHQSFIYFNIFKPALVISWPKDMTSFHWQTL